MIDTLSSDIEKEMAVAKTEEADAQGDYEETIKAVKNGWCNGRKGKKSPKNGRIIAYKPLVGHLEGVIYQPGFPSL